MKVADTTKNNMIAKISQQENFVISAQNLNGGKYKQFKDWNNDPNIQIDEYSNGDDIVGYCIRAYANEADVTFYTIIDYGNGSFDTNGWIKVDDLVK